MKHYAYYNEFDKNAATWLRELIKAGLIVPGDVDERSIIDVKAGDIKGYKQHHFFAGIGGWSYALRLAKWPDGASVWTASLPCQPFSSAGKSLGKSDERHLLTHFLELVKQCRPGTIFGEQVERAIAHGWLDDLQTTMEAEGYSVGCCVLGAHSIGAAHIRQRLYWVANSVGQQREQQPDEPPARIFGTAIQSEECVSGFSNLRALPDGRLGFSNSAGLQQRIEATETARYRNSVESTGRAVWMGNTPGNEQLRNWKRKTGDGSPQSTGRSGISWIYCRDNKRRPIEPGILPLVDGVSEKLVRSSDPGAPINSNATQEARAMRLKGYGNAIVPTLAAEFIGAFMELK